MSKVLLHIQLKIYKLSCLRDLSHIYVHIHTNVYIYSFFSVQKKEDAINHVSHYFVSRIQKLVYDTVCLFLWYYVYLQAMPWVGYSPSISFFLSIRLGIFYEVICWWGLSNTMLAVDCLLLSKCELVQNRFQVDCVYSTIQLTNTFASQ